MGKAQKASERQAGAAARTEGDRVYIPMIDPLTGEPTGQEAVVSLTDGDLAAAGPWYASGPLVYTIVRRLGTPIRLSLDAILMTRQFGGCIDAT
jgi:hypothetical protein